MKEQVVYLIENEAEGAGLDFKRKEYKLNTPGKYELLKDISSMANVASNDDKYIIIGVEEEGGIPKEFHEIEEVTDEAKYQNFVRENIEPEISFEYRSLNYKGVTIGYFRIFANTNRPYLFKKEIVLPDKRVLYRPGDGYIRKGSSTVKLTRSHFDFIYGQKNLKQDRKQDVRIEFRIKDGKTQKLDHLKYLDVCILNDSNESITFHVSLKIYRSDKLFVRPEHVLLRMMAEENNSLSAFSPSIFFPPSVTVSFLETESYYLIESNLNRGFTIHQNDQMEDVFDQNTFILLTDDTTIQGELTVRSDSFTSGMLVKQFEIVLQKEDFD